MEIKNIIFYLLFIFGLTEVNAIDIKQKNEYQDVKLNFDLDQLNQQYEKWKNINTGTYTYICKPNTFLGRNIGAILFVKNNVIVKRIILPPHTFKASPLYETLHLVDSTDNKFIKSRRDRAILRAHLDCYIDNIFVDILDRISKSSRYQNFEIDLNYDTNYSFISTLIVKKIPNKKYVSLHAHTWSINLSGMLMLPKNTRFTGTVVKKILKMYDKTWECDRQIVLDKQPHKENLNIEKERLMCLENHLVWEE